MRSPNLTWDELDELNHLERDVTAYARELREIGYDDPTEARLKLHSLVGLCTVHMARIERREREDADRFAREEQETAIPPYGGC